MKILFALSASVIDNILGRLDIGESMTYAETVRYLYDRSLFQSFSLDLDNPGHRLCVYNSATLSGKWHKEKKSGGRESVLASEIEAFSPDILYTNNPEYFSRERFNGLPAVPFRAAWRAAPFYSGVDLSHFDLGLSYAEIYLDLLREKGLANTALMQFHLRDDVADYIDLEGPRFDVSFCGSYHRMFLQRNRLLAHMARKLGRKHNLKYFLRADRRFFGMLPGTPPVMWKNQQEAVFLADYLSVIGRSRITFNCHSDFAGKYKGNMRVFETFAMKSFLLTDRGDYPPGLKDGEHFVSYGSAADLVDKVKYFLAHDAEREEIAANGHEAIRNEFSLNNGVRKLEAIFRENL